MTLKKIVALRPVYCGYILTAHEGYITANITKRAYCREGDTGRRSMAEGDRLQVAILCGREATTQLREHQSELLMPDDVGE